MTDIDRKTALREAARAAAAELCAEIGHMELPDLELHSVAAHKANGSNSLDEGYLARLSRGEHLTDNFLANI